VEPNDLAKADEETAATQHQRLDRWGPMAAHLTFFVPTVDGEVLPATPYEALAAGAGRDIELIAGHNRDERPGCRGGLPCGLPGRHCRSTLGLVQSDWLFRMPTLRLAEAHATGGGRTRFYELTWASPGAGGLLGACHGLDQPLVFGAAPTVAAYPEESSRQLWEHDDLTPLPLLQ
jgi:para-nitrobenzyl esterase